MEKNLVLATNIGLSLEVLMIFFMSDNLHRICMLNATFQALFGWHYYSQRYPICKLY